MSRLEKGMRVGAAVAVAAGGYMLGGKDKISDLVAGAGIQSGTLPVVEPGRFEYQTAAGVSLSDPKGILEEVRIQQSAAPLETARQSATISSRSLRAGEAFIAPAGSIVGGEAFIEGERLFDDLANTGQISVINEEATVTSPFGGFIISGGSEEEMGQILGRVMMETLANGCGNGCNEVDLIDWPGGRQARGAAPVELDHEMRPGETLRVRAGSIIKGDVVVNGRRFFDNDENSGSIVEVNKNVDVFAEFGANVTWVGCDKPTVDRLIGAAVEEMKAHGCVGNNGCDKVEVFKVGPPLVCDVAPRRVKPIPAPIITPTPPPKGK